MSVEDSPIELIESSGLASVPEPRRHFSFPPTPETTQVRRLIEADRQLIIQIIQAAIKEDRISLADTLFYNPIVFGDIRQDSEGKAAGDLKKKRNLIPAYPYEADETRIKQRLEQTAREAYAFAAEQSKRPASNPELVVSNIRKALLLTLRTNVETADRTPLLRADIYDPQPEESRPYFSTQDVRKSYRRVKALLNAGEIDMDNAQLEMLYSLGILKRKDLREMGAEGRQEVLNDLRRNLDKAWKLYEEVGKNLAKIQKDFSMKGHRIHVSPYQGLKSNNFFELLDLILGTQLEEDDKYELKIINEALSVLNLAYLFFCVRKNKAHMNALREEHEVQNALTENLFVKNEKGRSVLETVYLPLNKYSDIMPGKTNENGLTPEGFQAHGFKDIELRKLLPIHTTNFGDVEGVRVHFIQANRKESASEVKKLLRYPDYTSEKISDKIRFRMVLWDHNLYFNEETKNDPQTLQIANGAAKQAGLALGLIERNYQDRAELKPGEFCIISKLKKKGANGDSDGYPAIKFYGLSASGVPIEGQIIGENTYRESESPSHPSNHYFYEASRDIGLAQKIYRGSARPNIVNAIKTLEAALKNRKARLKVRYRKGIADHLEAVKQHQEDPAAAFRSDWSDEPSDLPELPEA